MLKERFIDYLRFEKRFSSHTLKSYTNDLTQFESYLRLQYAIHDLSRADHHMIRSWIVSLLEAKSSPRTVNRKLSALKAFYRFCRSIGEMNVNPASRVVSPKTPRTLPVFIEKEKLEQLFLGISQDHSFEQIRNRLIIMMLYGTGMRRAEILGITGGDIDLNKGTIKVLGKRNKERIIPIGDYLCRQLEIYIKERELIKFSIQSPEKSRFTSESGKSELPDQKEISRNNPDSLFVLENGKRMTERKLYSIVHHYLTLVSSRSKLSPHILRHTFATHMLDDGADLNAIREILGHSSLAATQVYTHTTVEKLKLIYNQAHPRA
jgi:integrase/recombinase XerC